MGIEKCILFLEGEELYLFIEKDFLCFDRLEEDKLDIFWELVLELFEVC